MGGYSGEHDISINSGNQVYGVLSKEKYNTYRVIIEPQEWFYLSDDGEHFKDLFWFAAPTFARAFAYLDGWFYFGLGTEIKSHGEYTGKNAWTVPFSKTELSSAAGTVLRCPAPPSVD